MTRSATFGPEAAGLVRRADAVRVAQVGLAGGIGFCHLNEYAKNPHFQYVGGYDRYPQDVKVAEALARLRHMGAKIYGSFEEVLADPQVEAVDICTPHHFHSEMALAAFRAGKHVLVEKPMAPHPAEAAAMCEAQRAAGKVGAVQMQQVGRSSMLQLRAAIHAGAIGALKEVFLSSLWWRTEEYYNRLQPPKDWPGHLKVDGKWCVDGALYNQCVHYITQTLILASPGAHPTVARARDLRCAMYKFHESKNLEAGDTAFVTARLDVPGQPRLSLIGTTCSAEDRHQIELIGERGRALWNGTGYLFPEGQPMVEYRDDNREFDGTSRIFTSWAQAIRGEGLPLTNFAEIRHATEFIYGCYEACGWNIKKVPWSAAGSLPEVIGQVRRQRALPGDLQPRPTWA